MNRNQTAKKLDRSDFFWLVYLVFFLIQPAVNKSLVLWVEALVSIAIFLVLYFKFLQTCNWNLRVILLGLMYLLGAINLSENGGAVAFFIYVAALLPFALASIQWVIVGLVLDFALFSTQA